MEISQSVAGFWPRIPPPPLNAMGHLVYSNVYYFEANNFC